MIIHPDDILASVYQSFINKEDSHALNKNLSDLEKSLQEATYISSVFTICQILAKNLQDAIVDYRKRGNRFSQENLSIEFTNEENSIGEYKAFLRFKYSQFSLSSEKITDIKESILNSQDNIHVFDRKFKDFSIDIVGRTINIEEISEKILTNMLSKKQYSHYRNHLLDSSIPKNQEKETIENKRHKI